MGFDVLYFPPIHPIGRAHRKGPNNSLKAGPGDPGSPYAIGSEEGGHEAVHPQLGSLEDFRQLVRVARDHGLEVALDFAVQCSPDHPWLEQHPGWFSWRPDGSIRHAETRRRSTRTSSTSSSTPKRPCPTCGWHCATWYWAGWSRA